MSQRKEYYEPAKDQKVNTAIQALLNQLVPMTQIVQISGAITPYFQTIRTISSLPSVYGRRR